MQKCMLTEKEKQKKSKKYPKFLVFKLVMINKNLCLIQEFCKFYTSGKLFKIIKIL